MIGFVDQLLHEIKDRAKNFPNAPCMPLSNHFDLFAQ